MDSPSSDATAHAEQNHITQTQIANHNNSDEGRTGVQSSPPEVAWNATASMPSKQSSLAHIRRGGVHHGDGSDERQAKEERPSSSLSKRCSSLAGEQLSQSVNSYTSRSAGSHQNSVLDVVDNNQQNRSSLSFAGQSSLAGDEKLKNCQNSSPHTEIKPAASSEKGTAMYKTTLPDNGYQFPPQHSSVESTVIGMRAFWTYATTPLGFLVTIYGLNIVAWGGMIFLLLCNASPAMCHPTCNDINSPRRIWIEIDSQVLTALFCVTGFGLIPWRFRDLYYLLRWRFMNDSIGLRRLAGIHRNWFRLEGSQNLPVTLGPGEIEEEHAKYPELSLPYPVNSIPNAPLTGIRAPPTATWRLDYVIWMFAWNTFLQAVLSGLMWGLSRYTRPNWSTGLFVALACIVAAMAGIEIFIQGRNVKAMEGVPVNERDLDRLERDRESGRFNINTLSGKLPKEKKGSGKTGRFGRKTTLWST